MRWPRFVRQNDGICLYLDRAARRYGQRPSALVGVSDEWEALYLDCHCADVATARAEHVARRAKAMGVYDLS